MSPFLHIVDNRDLPALRAALEKWGSDPEGKQSDLDNLLLKIADQNGHHRAKFANLATMAELALDAGADINAPGVFGSPLSLAVSWGNLELAQLLINRGARLDATGAAPLLHHAVKEGNRKLAQCLLEAGAPLEARDKRGRTALFETMEHAKRPFQRLLVKAGADPCAIDDAGNTLWHELALAARTDKDGVEQTMRQLCRWGVDPEQPNTKGESPRAYAAAYNIDKFTRVFDVFFAEQQASKLNAQTPATQTTPRRRPGL